MIKSPWDQVRVREWFRSIERPRAFNYLPRTAVNSTEMWQAETFDRVTIDQELRWAASHGYNGLRVFLQYLVWDQDRQGFKGRFDEFLSICEVHGLRVMPVLFDDCAFGGKAPYLGRQDDPVPGVHNSQWVPSPGPKLVTDERAWPRLEKYVSDVVDAFSDDDRVLVWDLYNEPGNANMGERSLPLVEEAFIWARAVGPSQPLTVGPWRQLSDRFSTRLLELSDVISFHCYENPERVRQVVEQLSMYERPLLCTEWLKRQDGNTFDAVLPIFDEFDVGWYHWGLVAGRSQTYMPWGSQAGDLVPELWQHDVLRPDGTPYSAEELRLVPGSGRARS